MDKYLMYVMAFGAILGGFDYIIGNKFGFGKKFEDAFMLLGPTALSMAGIIYMAPLIAKCLGLFIVPVWQKFGFDPGMLGGLLAIDMGGYQLALELTKAQNIGNFAGLIIAATLGCTLTFTIPVGMGMIEKNDQPFFTKGILYGLGVLPVVFLSGGLLCKIQPMSLIWQCVPFFLFSLVLMVGIVKWPCQISALFSAFAKIIQIISVIGLIFGAVEYMTGWMVISSRTPLIEGMKIVGSIGIVMLGSLPLSYLIQKVLKKPLGWIGKCLNLDEVSITGLLIGCVSVVPAIALMKEMNKKGKIINAAFIVCNASTLAAHVGFTFSVAKDMVGPLLISKFLGGILCILVVCFIFRKQNDEICIK